jgi:hypothetical protein
MSIAGRATPLVDGIEKVTGRARYTADLGFSSLCGEILRSPHAHAELVIVDTRKARALPGVRAVITGADCAIPYGILPIAHNEYPLARGRVRYWGEPVAAVAAQDEATARAALANSLASGAAAERFARMVANLGGPADFLEDPARHLAQAPVVVDVPSPAAGRVLAIDTRAVGFAVVALGGGRTAPEQSVDPAVGFDRLQPRGARVAKDEPLARVHAASRDAAEAAASTLTQAYTIGNGRPEAPPLVERIDR